METQESTVWRYVAAAVAGLILGGAIVFAFAPGTGELNQVRAQRDTLGIEVQGLKERIGPLQSEVQALKEQNAAHRSEIDRLAATLAEKEQAGAKASGALGERGRATAGLEERNRDLAAENEAMKKKLAALGEKAEATAAEREALARKLGAAGQTLEQAQARAAELNKSYEALLTEKTTLADRAAARRAELESTKKALEAAQSEVARLMGARGIYTVQDGDSLSMIAAFFYRNGLRWPDIFKANSFLISHPDLIYPKQVLIIPQ